MKRERGASSARNRATGNGRGPIVLVFPPHSGHLFYPCLSLPSLAAYLRARGHDVVQLDWGLETFDIMLSRGFLERTKIRNREAARSLSEKKRRSAAEKRRLHMLERARGNEDYVYERIDEAKDILRDRERFFDPRNYSFAAGVITEALKVVSAGFHPTKILDNRLVTAGGYTLRNISNLVVNRDENPFLEILEDLVNASCIEHKPGFVGISINYYSQIIGGFTIARLFKRNNPSIHICMGGAVISEGRRQITRDQGYFDFCDSYVFGEGEKALEHLVSNLDDPAGSCSERPRNILLRGDAEPGAEDAAPDSPVDAGVDINSLPTPDFTGLPLDRYLSPYIAFPVATSRGCYWRKCSFCSISVSSCAVFKARDVELVKEDLRNLITEYGAEFFFFNDNGIPPRYLRELGGFMASAGKGIAWTGMVRQEKELTLPLLRMIKDSGCLQLMIGQESANDRMIGLMRKGISPANSERIIRDAAKAGIAVTLMNIIGFPTETAEEADQTIQFLLRNKPHVYSAYVSPFVVRENSPVHKNPADFGMRYLRMKDTKDLCPTFDFSTSTGMSRREAERKYLEGQDVLFRAYPWSGLFLDEGVHSLLYLARHGYEEFKKMLDSLLLHFFFDEKTPGRSH